jgi:hypothetical protein
LPKIAHVANDILRLAPSPNANGRIHPFALHFSICSHRSLKLSRFPIAKVDMSEQINITHNYLQPFIVFPCAQKDFGQEPQEK